MESYASIVALAAGITAGCMTWDLMRYRIPNLLVLALLLLYPAFVWVAPHPVSPWSLAVALGALAVGMGLFAIRALGAGDVKLLAVILLWVAPAQTPSYFMLMGLLGGGLTIGLLVLRGLLIFRPKERLPRLLRSREPVPYGLAIGGAFLPYLWQLI